MRALLHDHQKRLLGALLIYVLFSVVKPFWLPRLGGWAFWFGDVVCFVLFPILLALWFKLPSPWALFRRRSDRSIAFTVRATLFVGITLLVVDKVLPGIVRSHMMQGYDIFPALISYASHAPAGGLTRVVVFVYFALTAAVVEEWLFRGVAADALRPWGSQSGKLMYVVLSTLLFTACHVGVGFGSMLQALISGVLLALLFYATKSFKALLLCHAAVWLTKI